MYNIWLCTSAPSTHGEAGGAHREAPAPDPQRNQVPQGGEWLTDHGPSGRTFSGRRRARDGRFEGQEAGDEGVASRRRGQASVYDHDRCTGWGCKEEVETTVFLQTMIYPFFSFV